jgi:CO/xanthine dehydrogenase FAD-binding subunit
MEEAVNLLERGIPFAGGTELTSLRRSLDAVIDLSKLGLDKIAVSDEAISIGATATLQSMLEETNLPTTLGEVCKLEAGWNLRNMSTLGGAIKSSDGRSQLITVLLSLDAVVHYEPGSKEVSLDEFLNIRDQLQIICDIEFEPPEYLLYEQVARAPRDFPLICAALAKFNNPKGETRIRIALGGYGHRPTLLGELDKSLSTDLDFERAAELAKRAFADATDAWAGAEYRSEVAGVLVKRLLTMGIGS